MRRLMLLALLLPVAGGYLSAVSCTDDYRDELPLRPLGDLSYQPIPDMAVASDIGVASDMGKGPPGNADMPTATDSGSQTDLSPSGDL